jgi:phage-related minor tail protein
MANPYSISTFLDAELGEAINHIIDSTGYGSTTFIVKEFMEKHKDELIAFWDSQNKNGLEIWDKWFKKWSLTKAQQDAIKSLKEKEKHDKLVKQYLVLGRSKEESEEFAGAFPDRDPCEVIKIRNYNTQTEIGKEKLEDKREDKQDEKKREKERELMRKYPEFKNLIELRNDYPRYMEDLKKQLEKDPNSEYIKRKIEGSEKRQKEAEEKIKKFLESQPQEPQQGPHP